MALAALAATAAPVRAGDETEVFEYVVKPGDTCMGIALRVFGDKRRFDLIHQHNPGMGPMPHHLRPGRVLRLPRIAAEPGGPDAQVSGAMGPVEMRAPEAETGTPASVGAELSRGWRVSAPAHASAELTFRDGSRVVLRDDTAVQLLGLPLGPTGPSSALLERGVLRARLGEREGKSPPRLRLELPGAEATLGVGRALVGVDGGDVSRVANHGGAPVVLRSAAGNEVLVGAGMGGRIARGGEPEEPRPLPPAPLWSEGVHTFAALPAGATVAAAWAPVAQAARYRVELARDREGREVVGAVTVSASTTGFAAHGLPAGTYHARVAAIDGAGFESPPSPRLELTVLPLRLVPPGATDTPAEAPAAGGGMDLERAPERPRVLPGTRVVADVGVRCAAGADAPAPTFLLSTPGIADVRCVAADGTEIPAVSIEVVAMRARAAAVDGKPLRPLRRDQTTQVLVHVDSPGAMPPLSARAGAGIEVVSVVQQGPDAVLVTLRPGPGAPRSAALELAAAEQERPVLAAVTVQIAAAAPTVTAPPPPPSPEGQVDLAVGCFVGAFLPDQNYGFAAGLGDGELETATMAGAAIAYGAASRFAIEGEAAVALFHKQASDKSATALWLRGNAIARLANGRVRPLLLGGAGVATSTDGDADPELHAGVGATLRARRGLEVRLDVRWVLSAGKVDSLAQSLGFQIGLVNTIGD